MWIPLIFDFVALRESRLISARITIRAAGGQVRLENMNFYVRMMVHERRQSIRHSLPRPVDDGCHLIFHRVWLLLTQVSAT